MRCRSARSPPRGLGRPATSSTSPAHHYPRLTTLTSDEAARTSAHTSSVLPQFRRLGSNLRASN